VCVCVCVCTVADFSAEDKTIGVKFCTMVHRRPGQGISHIEELCSPEAHDESASAQTKDVHGIGGICQSDVLFIVQ